MKTAFSGLSRRLDMAEGRVSEQEGMSMKLPESKSKENKDLKKQNIQELWDHYRNIHNVHRMQIPPKRQEGEKYVKR